MNDNSRLPPDTRDHLAERKPFLWINDQWRPFNAVAPALPLNLSHVQGAEALFARFAPLLADLFPDLEQSAGQIESTLQRCDQMQAAEQSSGKVGRWLVKCDHALPVVGSIKARGGFYEILATAEWLALKHGLIQEGSDRRIFGTEAARQFFAEIQIAVGSTGNLGLSVGVMAAALGFQATVHMSRDAKAWKKARLRAVGASVIEHAGDYGAAVAAGRAAAGNNPKVHFVDDEHSPDLFLGYAAAGLGLRRQLAGLQVPVDGRHPLFVYLPCGVGGAPCGITFALRSLFGDHVHCFFAEPVASPCVLARLAVTDNRPINVHELGLDNRTEADGLAVGQASEFVVPFAKPLVSGVYTVQDEQLFADLYVLERSEGLRIEPSAAAGFSGPDHLLTSEAGRQYLTRHGLQSHLAQATHLIWTTGGSRVPEDEYQAWHQRGEGLAARAPA